MESACTFNDGLRSWIINVKFFLRHAFSTENISCMCLQTEEFSELCSATLWCKCRLVNPRQVIYIIIYINTEETKCLYFIRFSLIYSQTTKKQSLCLDNDESIIETSDSINSNNSNLYN